METYFVFLKPHEASGLGSPGWRSTSIFYVSFSSPVLYSDALFLLFNKELYPLMRGGTHGPPQSLVAIHFLPKIFRGLRWWPSPATQSRTTSSPKREECPVRRFF